jgi:ribosomal protein S18 acetylase RimI-like enzyme
MIIEINNENIITMNNSNEPFTIFGKLIPEYINGCWSFKEELFKESYEYKYPPEDDDYEEYINNKDKTVYFYYDGKNNVGQIILKKYWNENTFIKDFSVSKNYRKKGIGWKLMDKAKEWTKANNLKGIMLETQDVNLAACRFYKKYGFTLGGVDTMLYSNFKNAEQKALFWYYKI